MIHRVFAVCLACIVAGCGSAGSSEPLSADDYRAEVAALCREARMEASSLPDRTQSTDVAEVRGWDEDEKEHLARYVARLEELVPPPELEVEARAFASVLREHTTHWGDYLDSSREGTSDEVDAALTAASNDASRLNNLVESLEIPDCAAPAGFTAYGWQAAP